MGSRASLVLPLSTQRLCALVISQKKKKKTFRIHRVDSLRTERPLQWWPPLTLSLDIKVKGKPLLWGVMITAGLIYP